MTMLEQLKTFSWMSQASYLTFVGLPRNSTGPGLAAQLTNSEVGSGNLFAAKQAETFSNPTSGFTFADHYPNDAVGFSATVFQNNVDGSYTFAIRGTEPTLLQAPLDLLLADGLGVALTGKAREQTIAAYRYYKQLTTVPGQLVTYSTQEKLLLAGLYTGTFNPLLTAAGYLNISVILAGDTGLGSGPTPIIPAGASINFTGHSLGGHVAMLLAQLVAKSGTGNVGDILTYNAPGFGGIGAEVLSWFGFNWSDSTLANKITNVYGDGGLNITANLAFVPGIKQAIFIEREGNISGPSGLVPNHSVVKLSDSLALYDLLSRLDPSLSADQISTILQASANNMPDSLEMALDALRKAFLGTQIALTKSPGTADSDTTRAAYYDNLTALLGNSTFQGIANTDAAQNAVAGQVVSLVGMFADQITSIVRTPTDDNVGQAFRYALKELNSFAVVGVDYSQLNQNGEFDLYNAAGGTPAGMTSQYIADRAAMLAWKNLDYTADGQRALRGKQPLTFDYTDKTLKDANGNDLTFRVVGTQQSTVNTPVKFVFGSDQNETLAGGDVYIGDHLYGGGGNDTLIGNGGSDYLEGGRGDDTYVYSSGDGQDTILDTDGAGKIAFNGVTLAGGMRLAPGDYISGDKQFRYVFHGDLAAGGTLVINGDLRIESFKNGDLGIALGDPASLAEIQPTTRTYLGILSGHIGEPDFSMHGSNGDDHFIAGQGLSLFLGKAGNDLLEGNYWDFLIGGAGDDVITAGEYFEFGPNTGELVLAGGAGSDIILGGQVAENIYGDMEQAVFFPDGNSFGIDGFSFEGESGLGSFRFLLNGYGADMDWGEPIYFPGGFAEALNYILGISASTDLSTLYDDFIDGGDGNDRITGGFGSDILVGGAGNDIINGGVDDPFNFRLGNFANLFGPPGDDYLDGGDGNDTLSDGDGNDTFIGGNGNDNITSGDSLNGTITYENYLEGGDGNDALSSTNRSVDGFDTFLGGAGNDALTSVYGNALLDGGTGNDIYAIRRSHVGQITIQDHDSTSGNLDRLNCEVLPSEVGIARDESNLYLNVSGIQDKVTLLNWFVSDDDKIEEVRFQDGTVWNIATLTAMATPRVDPVVGTADGDVLVGLDGVQNWLNGAAGNDTLIGGNINDVLYGGLGDDTLAGGEGNDILRGGQGNDTYMFSLRDGVDRIEDNEGSNTVQFGPGITPDMLTLGLGSLLIRVGASGDAIHLDNFNRNDVLSAPSIDTFRFDDGTSLAYANLVARGFDIIGTGGNDFLTGTNVNDRFDGGQGNDQIYGRAGDDLLDGGEGDDSLQGGQGNNYLDAGAGNDYIYADGTPNNATGGSNFVIGGTGNDWINNYGNGTVVAINPGDGNDTVYAVGSMTLSLGGGIVLSDLALSQVRDYLVLSVGTSDSIRLIRQWGSNPLAWPQINLQLVGGAISGYDFSAAIGEFYGQAIENPGLNLSLDAILPSHPVSTSTTQAIGGAFAYQYAVNGNTDALSIAAKQAVLADASFGLAPQSITVNSPNRAPVLANAIADLNAVEDGAFTFQVPANTFADIDVGDTLAYSATLANGAPLPSWLSFDAATRSFAGTPGNADVGTLSVKVNAADRSNLSVSDTFDLTVVNVNDAPTLDYAMAALTTDENAAFAFVVPADTFSDADIGDTLSYSAAFVGGQALPSWLSFDAINRSFTGTPMNSDVGTLSIRITATDSGNLSVSDAFDLTVINVNDAPTLTNAIADQGANEDVPFSFQVAADAFIDVDIGDTLTYGAARAGGSVLPEWLNFNPATRTFSGTPANGDVGLYDIEVTATDSGGLSASDAFGLQVINVNDAPVLSNALPDQFATETTAFSFRLESDAFTDEDARFGDTLTYSATLANGSALPGWLAFNAATRTFSGTPARADVGALNFKVAATDTGNLSAFDIFSLTVAKTPGRTLIGTAGNDTLLGGAGDDTLDGGAGVDTLIGGLGDDVYFVGQEWPVDDDDDDHHHGNEGVGNGADPPPPGHDHDHNDGPGTSPGHPGSRGGAHADSNGHHDSDHHGGSHDDHKSGDDHDDHELWRVDEVVENAGEGYDIVFSSTGFTLPANVEELRLTGEEDLEGRGNALDNVLIGNDAGNILDGGAGNDTLRGGTGADTLRGGTGSDLLNGGAGGDTLNGDASNDILKGMDGNDTLADTGGNNLFNGGLGADTMTGNSGNELFIGGAGNDTITPGTGKDIIAFNRGDGQDTINASAGADNTLSIGGGIRYADMTFTKSAKNLVLKLGGSSEKVTLTNWYASSPANKSIMNLQVIAQAMADFNASSADPLLNKRVANFNFSGLASAFDAAGAPANWALTNAMLAKHLSGSDTAALGGDLAYRYGLTGSLANVGFDPAVAILSNASFGTAAQAFQSQAALEQGVKRLS